MIKYKCVTCGHEGKFTQINPESKEYQCAVCDSWSNEAKKPRKGKSKKPQVFKSYEVASKEHAIELCSQFSFSAEQSEKDFNDGEHGGFTLVDENNSIVAVTSGGIAYGAVKIDMGWIAVLGYKRGGSLSGLLSASPIWEKTEKFNWVLQNPFCGVAEIVDGAICWQE